MNLENVPVDLKNIQPFLQRSSELQKREPIVSYYCLYYAVKLAIEKGPTENSRSFLSKLLDHLEQEKKMLSQHEEISNEVVGLAHVENFALRIFNNGDKEDRNGAATKKTAKTFLAASQFFEILKVFGDLNEDIQQKMKYSKFKAADIMKSLNEGRVPQAGPPKSSKDENDINILQENSSTANQPGSLPTTATFIEEKAPIQNAVNPYEPQPLQGMHLQQSFQSQVDHNPYQPLQQQNPYLPLHQQKPIDNPYLPNQNPVYNQNPYISQQTPSFVNQDPYEPMTVAPTNSVNFEPSAPPISSPNPYITNSNNHGDIKLGSQLETTPISNHNQHQQTNFTVNQTQSNFSVFQTPGFEGNRGFGADPFAVDHTVIANAQKAAKHAISALQYEDVDSAILNLKKAISLLQPFHKK
ncbi:hypothetical protein HK099_005359 [Clydaea vesicula]|uniref:Uncharacterized protein n=1 Tax=Clydaea vesicula TaxID=447962 RepID=A0AAD5TZA5_9FUNG|nr:hypothetical protein HK099_005359 [Clydaea vesicula]